MISAKIIADSKNEYGNRLTTFLLVMPRIVLAEFNTHRMISRNSASSRAIPFDRMIETIRKTPFIPIKWMKEHKGMQGTEFFTDADLCNINNEVVQLHRTSELSTIPQLLEEQWLAARDLAIVKAKTLSEIGLTKQIVNRLLEPWMYHTVIATASDWENFFALRAHEAAEIHMQDLAYKMLKEYNESEPKLLQVGEWHIPFGDKIDNTQLCKAIDNVYPEISQGDDKSKERDETINKIKIATARCARVSYTIVGEEGKSDNYENDIKLHDRLAGMGHWSPFEHCAQTMNDEDHYNLTRAANREGFTKGWLGNFQGFIQYRKTFKDENKSDSRVKNDSKTVSA